MEHNVGLTPYKKGGPHISTPHISIFG
jgi:hypothetical protein